MADYEGRVRLTADTSEADRALNGFVGRLEKTRPVRFAIDLAGFRQAEQSFGRLQRNIGNLYKTPLNILTGLGAGSSSQSDTYRQLSQGAKDFFSAIASGRKDLAATTAGLRQQGEAFRSLADNINFTDESQKRFFRSFTQGAEMARVKGVKANVEQIRALQDLYQSGITGLKEDIAPRAGGIQQLFSIGKDLPRTKAALSEYRAELERAFDLVETRSGAGGLIAVEISNVEKALLKVEQDRAEANDQINNVKRAGYALTRSQLSLEEENLALIERQADARRRAQQAANDLYNRDRALSRDFGVNPAMALRPAGVTDEGVALRNLISTQSKLNAIEEENLAAVERRIAARQQEVEVANRLVREQRQQAIDIYSRDRALSRDFGVNPGMALRPAGVSDEDVALRNLISTQSRLNAVEEENLAAVERRVAARQAEVVAANQLVQAQRQQAIDIYNRDRALSRDFGVNPAMTLRPAGVSDADVARINPAGDLARIAQANRDNAAARAEEFRRTQGLSFDERLARRRPDLAPGGTPRQGFFRGSARKAVGEGLIGGAFPLLFGQGLGASAGGLAGGALGGSIGGSFGFGLSLAGTALGTAIDTTANNLKELASSLKSPNDAIAGLEASGFRVGNSLKFQVEQLQAVGRGYDAQTLVLQEVQRRLGPGSLTELKQLDTAQKQLQEQWGAIAAEIQSRLLPVLQGFVEFLGSAAGDISGFAGQSRLQRLDPEKFEQLRTQAIRETASGPFGAFGNKEQFDSRLNELSKQELSRRFSKEREQVGRLPQDFIADTTFAIDANERNKNAQREYKSLVRQVEDFRRDSEDKIFNMRRQAADIEKQKADLRLEVENKIFDMRQETARLEIDNARSRAQLETQSFDLGLQQQADALGGSGGDFIDQVRDYLRIREEGEANLQANEATVKLQIASKERELQQYVLQVSDKVAAIARTVEDYKRDQAKFRFETSRRLEDYRMEAEDYIYKRTKERYDYAIGSELEMLRIKMEAATQLGATLPPDAAAMLGSASGRVNPVSSAGLANPFGPQRSGRPPSWNDGLGAGRGHQGQDVGLDVGTTIHAMEDAVVHAIYKGFGRAGREVGDAVVLRYERSQNLGVYGHIDPAKGLAIGQRVTAGQQIGVVTPDKGNEHLHKELRSPSGQVLNPGPMLKEAMKLPTYATPAPVKPQPQAQPQAQPAPVMQPTSLPGRLFEQLRRDVLDSIFNWGSSLPDAGTSPAAQSGGGFDMGSLSKLGTEYEDVAMTRAQAAMIIKKLEEAAVRKNITPNAFSSALSQIGEFANSPDASRRTIRNLMAAPGAGLAVRSPALLRNLATKQLSRDQAGIKESGVNPETLKKQIEPMLAIITQLQKDNLLRKNVTLNETRDEIQKPLYGALLDWVKANINNPQIQEILKRSTVGSNAGTYGTKGLLPIAAGFEPESFGVGLTPAAMKADREAEARRRYEATPAGKAEKAAEEAWAKKFREDRIKIQQELDRKFGPRSEAVDPGAFDMSSLSKISTEYAPVASTAQKVPVLPFSQQVDPLPTYGQAPPAAPALRPAEAVLPDVPPPMAAISTTALSQELGRQKGELEESLELQRKLQKTEEGRALLQLSSTREVRNRVEDATKELNLETRLLGVDSSLSQNEQERSAERIRALAATEDINAEEKQRLAIALQLLQAQKNGITLAEYDQLTQSARDRAKYEKELLVIAQQSAEVARTKAFNDQSGALAQSARLAGAGLRAGYIGPSARVYQDELARSNNPAQAKQLAEQSKLEQAQLLVWENLERNIVDVSDAISGALTNGLVDVISGAKRFEDVGREVLDGISRSFADSAQQQLSNLLQNQLAGLVGGQGGLLSSVGVTEQAHTAAMAAHTRALLAASAANGISPTGGLLGALSSGGSGPLSSVFSGGAGGFNPATFGSGGLGSLFSSVLGGALPGLGAAAPALSSVFSAGASAIPGIGSAFTAGFGGFLAEGGPTRPGEAYVVGEKEPEFFFPNQSGRVVPMSDMQKAAALSEDDGGSNEPIDVRYTVTEQRGERYVTEEQFRKGMASTAKRAQAMTYAGMRNDRDVRQYTGLS